MSSLRANSSAENREENFLSLWSKARESTPNISHTATYKRPTVISSSKTPLYALLIGINTYRSETLRPLRGAVADALAFQEYLETDLAIPTENIQTLLNRLATRAGIMEALVRLRDDDRISKGDPIFIFYAGYGSETQSSETSLTMDRCIVPYDYSEKQGHEISAITHRTIAALLSQIVGMKGDNVTIVFDCSYSPLTSQESDEFSATRLRSVRLQSLKHSTGLLETGVGATVLEKPYLIEDDYQFILLSACSPSEGARETNERGNFSKAILNLLRHSSPHELAYSDFLSRIGQIPGQTPQCAGRNKSRSLFDTKVPVTQRTCFHLTHSDGRFTLHAGTIHGITSLAEFTVYSSDDFSFNAPLGTLHVDLLGAFSTTLTFPLMSDPFAVPPSALAILEDIRIYIPPDLPCYEPLVDLMRGGYAELQNIGLVDSPRNAHIEIAEENDKALFFIRDEQITQHGSIPLCDTVELTVEGIIPVLKAAAHYNRKINRTYTNDDISTNVEVAFCKLEDSSLNTDDFGAPELVPGGSNLYHNNMVEFVVEDCPYGLKLTNNGPYDLYPYMFYFDNSDLSIGAYYQPPTNEALLPPLKRDGGTLGIGYGLSGTEPFACYLRDNQDLDVGLIKLFLATSPVDLSDIPQLSPFDTGYSESVHKFIKPMLDTLATIHIPLILHRFPPHSKQCPKCGHVIFDDA